MRVLVVGGGGREHAICWRIARDRPDAKLYAAPGNGGIGEVATLVPIMAADIEALVAWCREERPELVVVGPDDPLAAGLVDALEAAGIRAFGPSAAAARIEASKAWAAEVCATAGVPMPESRVFDSADAADAFVRERGTTLVVKADGLSLGKGVVVPETIEETHAAIDRLARRRELGEAGARIVLQERLVGPELSVFAICDGTTYRVIGWARDHKRIGDGDRGPNTGGMGAYVPVPEVDEALIDEVGRRILAPTLAELRRRGRPFVGFLYAGLMLTARGPMVIELNARLGDPEAQALMPLLPFDLVSAIEAAIDGRLSGATLGLPTGAAVCVVMASRGYPGAYETGFAIYGLDRAGEDALVFHAGTRRDAGRWLTAGGRVLGITGLGASLPDARARAYAAVESISFEGAIHRTDIAAGAGQEAIWA
jgi:phosphoribosylamine--glycine ligase